MAGKGGARPGAGRKPKAIKYERPINAAEKQIVQKLPAIMREQIRLALGGIETVKEEWEPAGLVQIDGEIINPDGKSLRIKQLAFPGLPADQLVLVKKTVEQALPDRNAGQYLIDRIHGKPTVHVEDNTEQERQVPPDIMAMINKVYGDKTRADERDRESE